jgi:glucose/mannose-6-phosphate isomerase
MSKFPVTMKLDDMRSLVSHFPDMLRSIDLDHNIIDECKGYHERGYGGLCFLGMGGSSIVGLYVSELLRRDSLLPISIIKDYTLPRFVTKDWIVIAVSYSGNTAETLSALKEADERGSKIITITSGGQIQETYSHYPQLLIRKGLQPRAAFPLLLSGILPITETIIGAEYTKMDKLAESLVAASKKWGEWIHRPDSLACKFLKRIPLFIGAEYMKPVAYRAKTQVNENAKTIAFGSEIPEAAHNEIEGFQENQQAAFIPVFLKHGDESKQIQQKQDVMQSLYEEIGMNPVSLRALGKSPIEKMLTLTHYLDMVSVELAEMRGVDALAVNRITELKKRLAKRG